MIIVIGESSFNTRAIESFKKENLHYQHCKNMMDDPINLDDMKGSKLWIVDFSGEFQKNCLPSQLGEWLDECKLPHHVNTIILIISDVGENSPKLYASALMKHLVKKKQKVDIEIPNNPNFEKLLILPPEYPESPWEIFSLIDENPEQALKNNFKDITQQPLYLKPLYLNDILHNQNIKTVFKAEDVNYNNEEESIDYDYGDEDSEDKTTGDEDNEDKTTGKKL